MTRYQISEHQLFAKYCKISPLCPNNSVNFKCIRCICNIDLSWTASENLSSESRNKKLAVIENAKIIDRKG